MSTATAFLGFGSFPFCVTDISGSVPGGVSYVDNLTLAQVMQFAWNLETITFTTEGSAVSGALIADGDNYITIGVMASDHMDVGSSGGDMWFGDALTGVAFSSWPAIRQPVERICPPSSTAVNGALLDFGAAMSSDPGVANCEIGFFVGTDPVNAGKYRLYYELDFSFADPGTETIQIIWRNVSGLGGWTAFSSGTITIAGISLNWYSYVTPGSTATGTGDLTASSGSFTY